MSCINITKIWAVATVRFVHSVCVCQHQREGRQQHQCWASLQHATDQTIQPSQEKDQIKLKKAASPQRDGMLLLHSLVHHHLMFRPGWRHKGGFLFLNLVLSVLLPVQNETIQQFKDSVFMEIRVNVGLNRTESITVVNVRLGSVQVPF